MKKSRVHISLLLSLVLTLMSFLPVAAQGSGQDVKVHIRVEAENSTMITETEVTLPGTYKSLQSYGVEDDKNGQQYDPGYYTAVHAIAQYYAVMGVAQGEMKDKGISLSWGSADKIGGKTADSFCPANKTGHFWMFAVNNVSPVVGMDSFEIKNGDSITIYSSRYDVSGEKNTDYYAWFEKTSYQAETGEPVALSLKGNHYSTGTKALADASILISDEGGTSAETDTGMKTNAQGKAYPVFDQPGTYKVSARRDDSSRPYAQVVVTASDPSKDAEYVTEDKSALTLPSSTDKDLDLPLVGKSGKTSVSWSSENENIISRNGTVTRSEEDKTVKLTAVIKKGNTEETKDFNVKVLKNEKTPALKGIDFSIGSVAFDPDKTDYNVSLPTGVKQLKFSITPFHSGASITVEGAVRSKNRTLEEYTADVPGTVKITSTLDGNSKTYTFKLGYIKELPVQWGSFRGNNGVVSSRTARSKKEVSLKWKKKMATYSPGDMLIVNDCIYITGDSEIFMLSKDGKVVKKAQLDNPAGFATRPVYGSGMIFVPIGNGQIQAFTAADLQPVWTSDSVGPEQTMSTMTYADGYVYTGIGITNGQFVCLDAKNGELVWSHPSTQGYYWSGGAVVGNAVIVGGDDGILTSLNSKTGAVIDTVTIGTGIRSTIVYDKDGKNLLFTDISGKLHKTRADASGNLGKHTSVSFASNSTSTPAIAEGKAFVGGGAVNGTGVLSVVDIAKMKVIQSVSAPAAVQSSPVVTTGYKGKLYAYAASNISPGALYSMEYGSKQKEMEEIYSPLSGNQNYCAYSPVVDSEGTIYYSNDSGYLFALKGSGSSENKKDETESKKTASSGTEGIDLDKKQAGNPATGDSSVPAYWLMLLGAAGCILAAGLRKKISGR